MMRGRHSLVLHRFISMTILTGALFSPDHAFGLSTVTVIGDPDPYEFPFEPSDPCGDCGGEDFGGDSGGGGSTEDPMCPILRDRKPADCPDPIPMPAGATYASDMFPFGTGLQQAIAFTKQSNSNPTAVTMINAALSQQTAAMANLTTSFSSIN